MSRNFPVRYSRLKRPPSTRTAAPCTNAAAGDARKTITSAMSSGRPTSLRSIFSTPDFTFGLSHNIGVSTAPGSTALTRMRRAFERRRARERQQRGLGGSVRCHERLRLDRVHTRDVHHRAAFRHVQEGLPDEMKRPEQIDRENPLPVLRREIGNRLERHQTRIVHDRIHATKALQRRADGRLHLPRVAHVTRRAERIARPALLHRVGRRARLVLVQVRDHDAQAVRRETPRGREPDAAGAASHDRYSVIIECIHQRPP